MAVLLPYVPGIPGVRDVVTATPYIVFASTWGGFLPGGKVIDGSKSRDPGNTNDVDRLRPGVVMGKITASDKYAPSILGLSTVALTTVATTLVTSAAVATELARRIGSSGTFKLIGPPSAAGTVATSTVTYSAVNTSTGDITITATGVAFVSGSIIAPTDGSETPLTFIPDGWPMAVTNANGTSIDVQYPLMPVAGVVISSKLINYPSDSSLKTWLKQSLSTLVGGKYTFNDNF